MGGGQEASPQGAFEDVLVKEDSCKKSGDKPPHESKTLKRQGWNQQGDPGDYLSICFCASLGEFPPHTA
jgi:hypothetical protein